MRIGMSMNKILRLLTFCLIFAFSIQKYSNAQDFESGEELLNGCPDDICECINDSSRDKSSKNLDEEGSDGDSSSGNGSSENR